MCFSSHLRKVIFLEGILPCLSLCLLFDAGEGSVLPLFSFFRAASRSAYHLYHFDFPWRFSDLDLGRASLLRPLLLLTFFPPGFLTVFAGLLYVLLLRFFDFRPAFSCLLTRGVL